jgi:predicted RNA-binding Zn-ribbon protein involved in translation (DUF1610 family)
MSRDVEGAGDTVVCPHCGAEEITEIDVVTVYAYVDKMRSLEDITWQGYSKVDWESQRPADKPPHFQCTACGEIMVWLEGQLV